MDDLKKKLREGARLLAVAGAYVPAIHCNGPQQPPPAAEGPTEPVASSEAGAEPAEPPPDVAAAPAEPGAPAPGPEAAAEPAAPAPGPEAAAEPAAPAPGPEAAAEPAAPAPAEAAPPADLPNRPGAGSTAECRFLQQVALAASSGGRGADVRRAAVAETYGRFSAGLGRAYQGRMAATVDVVAVEPTLRFSVSYVPTSEPFAARYEQITVLYVLPLTGGAGASSGPTARTSAVGHLRAGGSEMIRPGGSCRVRLRDEDRTDCAYPRWNPRGARYGLFETITPEADE